MKTSMSPKFQCAQCDNDQFENLDGFYYCSVCNMKLQVSGPSELRTSGCYVKETIMLFVVVLFGDRKEVCDIIDSDEDVQHVREQELGKKSRSRTSQKLKNPDDDDGSSHIFSHDDYISILFFPVSLRIFKGKRISTTPSPRTIFSLICSKLNAVT